MWKQTEFQKVEGQQSPIDEKEELHGQAITLIVYQKNG